MSDHDATGVPERSNGDGTREAETQIEFSGEAATVVQAGSITGDVKVYNSPSHQPAESGEPVAISCEVRADYVIQSGWSDGVPVSGGFVRIYVEACADRAVLLRAMRPIVVTRRPPVRGTRTTSRGIPEVRKYTLNLDKAPPQLSGPKFLYTVTPDDPEVFELTVRCDRYDVEWRLELDWTCAGRLGTSIIDLGGHPFRFTSSRLRFRRFRGARL
jgi:hypothetical protein